MAHKLGGNFLWFAEADVEEAEAEVLKNGITPPTSNSDQ